MVTSNGKINRSVICEDCSGTWRLNSSQRFENPRKTNKIKKWPFSKGKNLQEVSKRACILYIGTSIRCIFWYKYNLQVLKKNDWQGQNYFSKLPAQKLYLTEGIS